jgi:fatty acid-binding protein DegV
MIAGAIKTLTELMESRLPPVGPFRAQVVHALNPDGAVELQKAIADRMPCYWLPPSRLSLVLGAHTGPSLIGAVLAPRTVFEGVS